MRLISSRERWPVLLAACLTVALLLGVLVHVGAAGKASIPRKHPHVSVARWLPSASTEAFDQNTMPIHPTLHINRWTVAFAYPIHTERDRSLPLGEREIVRKGRDGIVTVTETSYVRGSRVLTKTIRRQVTRPATPELVALGPSEPSRGSSGVASKTLYVKITAYSAPPGDHTATGTVVGLGTIAVDPRVIPYGTRMYVPGYGFGVADDTGSAIIGDHIDIFFPTYDQAASWGVHYEEITIYGS